MIENILRGRSLWIFRGTALLWVVIGAIAVGCNILAGHIELTIYTLLIAGYYAAFRLVWAFAGGAGARRAGFRLSGGRRRSVDCGWPRWLRSASDWRRCKSSRFTNL